MLSAWLVACAEGVDGSELDYSFEDSGIVHEEQDAGWQPEAGVILAPFDGGSVVPNLPDAAVVRDSGGAAQPKDSSTPAPVDSGTTKPVDASMPTPTPTVDAAAPQPPKPDAGPAPSANACAAAPAYATTTACSKCACSKCGTEVTACYASSEAAKNTQCGAIEACAETSKCTGESCFCGTSLTCLFPDGACRTQIQAGAGSDSLTDVQAARDDANSSVARANAVGACRLANCKSECGL